MVMYPPWDFRHVIVKSLQPYVQRDIMNTEIAIKETTGLQLLKWDIDYGQSSKDCKRGRTLRVTNQCATGTFASTLFGIYWE